MIQTSHKEDISAPLLPLHLEPMWTKNLRSLFFQRYSILCDKSVLLILLWNVASGLLFNFLLKPSVYLVYAHLTDGAIIACILASLGLIITPLAGYIADVIFGRFKVLVCSTYVMVVSLTVLLTILLVCKFHGLYGYEYELLIPTAVLSLVVYACGRIFFFVNVLQFGMDQLRDAPTSHSVSFLYSYYWCENLSSFFMTSMHLPGRNINITPSKNTSEFDTLEAILISGVLCTSIVSSSLILFIAKRKQHWFQIENMKINPYRLVYATVKFAVQHKKPIRRSAFTFCEDECPSRLDFGKLRYGGPFTTRQVEDVKVFFNIIKVLLALTPAFFLDFSAASTKAYSSYNIIETTLLNTTSPFKLILLGRGALSPLLIIFFLPLYVLLVRPLVFRCLPNMFKQMGTAIILLITLFAFYFLYDIINRNNSVVTLVDSYFVCKHVTQNYNLLINDIQGKFHAVFITIQNLFSSLYHTLLYIAVWKFICCQSPQHMKGLLFGLFFGLIAFFQFLAAVIRILFLHSWKFHSLSCQSGYFLFNLLVGLASLIIFIVTTRRYKYRKLDDICNIYKYAEDYYSIHE